MKMMIADGGGTWEGRLESGPQITNLPHTRRGCNQGLKLSDQRCSADWQSARSLGKLPHQGCKDFRI